MAKRKQAEGELSFPPLVCGTCEFCIKADRTEYRYWSTPPVFSHIDEVEGPVYAPRGAVVNPNDHRCRDFMPRMHA